MLFKSPVIEFFCPPELEGLIPEPTPAFKHIPEWYKKLKPDTGDRDHFGAYGMTAKKCLPMLDVMSLGYVMPLCGDLHVLSNPDLTVIQVTNPPLIKVCEYHNTEQVGNIVKGPPLKFINHWLIKTRPGYSTLFTPMFNNVQEDRFECFSAVVDTDVYPKEVNFPGLWKQKNHDDILPMGTPLVVAIPFKRSDVPRKPFIRKMTDDDRKAVDKIRKKQDLQRHYYTQVLREPRK